MPIIYLVILCGLLSIAYAVWATRSVLAADQGNERMREISAAIREGAQAYLTRQYPTIASAAKPGSSLFELRSVAIICVR